MGEDGTRMTLRVYHLDREGHITRDTGTREIHGTEGSLPTEDNPTAYPTCTCPRCRGQR